MDSEPSIILRPIQAGDQTALSAFFFRVATSGDEQLFHPHPMTDAEAQRRASYTGADGYYVLLIGPDIAAYGMLRGWEEGYDAPSLGIAVDAGRRGLGLARTMMSYLHSAARLRGAPEIMLKVYRNNEAAVSLYRSLGYELTELNPDEWRGRYRLGSS